MNMQRGFIGIAVAAALLVWTLAVGGAVVNSVNHTEQTQGRK